MIHSNSNKKLSQLLPSTKGNPKQNKIVLITQLEANQNIICTPPQHPYTATKAQKNYQNWQMRNQKQLLFFLLTLFFCTYQNKWRKFGEVQGVSH